MKILVTGGAGFIGSVTTEMLLDSGHEVTVFDNLERGHRKAIDERATFIEGDLRYRDTIFSVLQNVKPDAVIHFAAYALVPESMDNPEMYFRNNVVGGINLLEAMLSVDVKKIVFSSSCATYGQTDVTPITEDTPQQPANPYGESKLMFEQILRWHQELQGMNAVCLRYFNACGATEKFGEHHDPETHIIPIVLQAALGQRDKVSIFGDDYNTPDGTCLRDYVHIVDLADAHIRALTYEGSDAFNLGNESGYSVKDVIETAREITGREIPVTIAPRRPGDPDRLIASAAKAQQRLQWSPRFAALETIIESAWRWHLTHPEGYPD